MGRRKKQRYGQHELQVKWVLVTHVVQSTPNQTPFFYLERYNRIAYKFGLPKENATFIVSACEALKERSIFSVGYNFNQRPIYHMRKIKQYMPEFAELFNVVDSDHDTVENVVKWLEKNEDMFSQLRENIQ